MGSRRTSGKKLNSRCRPVVAGPGENQAEARAAHVAHLTVLVRAGKYAATIENLVMAITGRPLPGPWVT